MEKKLTSKRFHLGIGPDADWKLIFLFAVLLAFAMTLVNIFIFLSVARQDVVELPEGSEESLTLDINTLKQTASYYQGKQAAFNKILSGTSTSTADPSL